MSKHLFGENGSLSPSLFDKLINSIPLLCLYPNRTILPVELRNKTPVLVTGIENSLYEAVGSDDHYCFHKAVGTFNTDFLCHFVKRVALCLLLNTKETRVGFSAKFPATTLTTEEFLSNEYTSRPFREFFTVRVNDDFSRKPYIIRDMVYKKFKEAGVPEECIPDIFELSQPPRRVYRRTLWDLFSDTTQITPTFMEQSSRNVRRTGVLINEFLLL